MQTTNASIAIIIPVRNDDDALARLLSTLNEDPADGVDEIIVASAEDRPSTQQLVDNHDATLVTSQPGRGQQMNTGAKGASADILWFLHADARPSAGSISEIRRHISQGMVGGYFGFRFADKTSPGTRRLAALINWRADRGVPYGDQGLFFTRSFFTQHGGFDASPLFEEVSLVRKARATGRFGRLVLDIGVDPRRWEDTGWVRRTLLNRGLAIGHAIGISPQRLARWYRRF